MKAVLHNAIESVKKARICVGHVLYYVFHYSFVLNDSFDHEVYQGSLIGAKKEGEKGDS
jgi:hypothetical protein